MPLLLSYSIQQNSFISQFIQVHDFNLENKNTESHIIPPMPNRHDLLIRQVVLFIDPHLLQDLLQAQEI